MDSIKDVMNSGKFNEPPEVEIIKSFIKEKFHILPQVTLRETQIIIRVPNAALAGTLRTQLHELKALCQTKKRLIIRIN